MDKRLVPLGFGGISIPLGSHIAAFYRNREEQRSIVVPFIETGLKRGARCIYIIDKEIGDGPEEFSPGANVDVEAVLASGQLSILTTEETYLSEGYFSPEKMLNLSETFLRTAQKEGYGEVRIIGEMTWALQERSGVEQLMEYESMLNSILPGYPTIFICQYDLSRFPGDIIVDALKTHPDCILGGIIIHNHFYQAPEKFLRELRKRTD